MIVYYKIVSVLCRAVRHPILVENIYGIIMVSCMGYNLYQIFSFYQCPILNWIEIIG